jgi:hypothetical protein
MGSGIPRRALLLGVLVGVTTLAWAPAAPAHPFTEWSGTAGAFAWEAKRLACGVVGEKPSRVRAHTRWRAGPANGYHRLTFVRQIRADATSPWTTVQRQRRSTRNTSLEGTQAILHWSQFFFPLEGEGGTTSRHVVRFEWLRDRPGADRLVFARTRTLRACVVGG